MVYGSIAFLSGILFLVTIDPSDDTRKDETQQDGNNL
jgi:hypothetical protein